MKKILLIAPSWVGDAVMSQPLITKLKNSNEECLIDVLAPPWVCPIFQFMGSVNKTLLSPFKHGQLKLKERFAFGSFVRSLSYDECYILPNSFKSALIPFFARIPVRIGYVGECRYPLLTRFLSLDKKQVPLMVDRFTNLASRQDKKMKNKRKWPELSVSEIAKLAIRKQFLNATTKKIACFCPGAEFGPSKIWPYKKYAHIAKYLTWQGYLVVTVGSENDVDKITAYSTLYYVLINYIKVLSPVIPFITEKIYENLVSTIDNSAPKSIHLNEFPKFDDELFFDDIVEQIDVIKEIVSLGRSARNKVNIKIRQPLSKVQIFVSDIDKKSLKRYETQILEELNVKEIEYVPDVECILNYKIKPNFNILGQKFGKDINKVIKAINTVSLNELQSSFLANKEFLINDGEFSLNKEDVIIEENAKDDYSLSVSSNVKVSINTIISESLKEEGLVRDLIRFLQNHRKDCNFEVEDRIALDIKCDENFYNALSNNLSYFKNETLCNKIDRLDELYKKDNYLEIKSLNVELAIKRL